MNKEEAEILAGFSLEEIEAVKECFGYPHRIGQAGTQQWCHAFAKLPACEYVALCKLLESRANEKVGS